MPFSSAGPAGTARKAPATGPDTEAAGQHPARSTDAAFDLQFYRYGAPVPVRGGQPCPPGIPPIELSATEAARIERLARDRKAGLLTTARLAFHLRWSECRGHHPAPA